MSKFAEEFISAAVDAHGLAIAFSFGEHKNLAIGERDFDLCPVKICKRRLKIYRKLVEKSERKNFG